MGFTEKSSKTKLQAGQEKLRASLTSLSPKISEISVKIYSSFLGMTIWPWILQHRILFYSLLVYFCFYPFAKSVLSDPFSHESYIE